jgi:hypothetical protein
MSVDVRRYTMCVVTLCASLHYVRRYTVDVRRYTMCVDVRRYTMSVDVRRYTMSVDVRRYNHTTLLHYVSAKNIKPRATFRTS